MKFTNVQYIKHRLEQEFYQQLVNQLTLC